MKMDFAYGSFLREKPFLVAVNYDLPYCVATNFITMEQVEFTSQMRDSYVIDRSRVRGKLAQTIPVWVFRNEYLPMNRDVFQPICDEIGMRPLTFIELLAFIKQYSMIKEFSLDKDAYTNALGSHFDTEYGGKIIKASVSVIERIKKHNGFKVLVDMGLAPNEGFGWGMMLPVTDARF